MNFPEYYTPEVTGKGFDITKMLVTTMLNKSLHI